MSMTAIVVDVVVEDRCDIPHNRRDWLMSLFTKKIQHNLKNESDAFSRCYILIVRKYFFFSRQIICMENKTKPRTRLKAFPVSTPR